MQVEAWLHASEWIVTLVRLFVSHLKLYKGVEAASVHDAWLGVEGCCFACKNGKGGGNVGFA